MAVLVFKLYAHDRSAVTVHAPARLRAYLLKQQPHTLQVARVIGARRHRRIAHYPVGQAAISAFAMRKRPDPEHYRQPRRTARIDERAQVALPREVPLAWALLVVYPEHVCRRYLHSAGAHLGQFRRPTVARVS